MRDAADVSLISGGHAWSHVQVFTKCGYHSVESPDCIWGATPIPG